MALTGMQIYKNLPKTNCKDCGLATCMAFAMQVASKQRALTDCPHITDDAKSSLSEASAPPMRLIKIGSKENQFEIGQETVMFRHEEKFHRATGIAIRIAASLSIEEASEKAKKINNAVFERVGSQLKVALCAVEIDGCENPVDRVKKISGIVKLPLILIGKDTGIMKEVAESIKDERPLIYKADASNLDAFADIAVASKLPIAVSASNLEELADLTAKLKQKGINDIVLSFTGTHIGETVQTLTKVRRAALKKKFRNFGYPSMVEVVADTPESETIFASTFAVKFAAIVIIDGCEPWEVLPILTTIQDVYTDPQVPNMVEAKLYEIGSPDRNSPVLFTTNFSLTYFSVASEVERSKIPAYISVVDTEGLGVLNAYAGDKISVDKVIKALADQKVSEKVDHRKLIIPGFLPIFRAEIEDESEWKEVIIGPETAGKIPAFLNKIWK